MRTANINLRIEPEIKTQAEAVFPNIGLSVTDAIHVFLHTSIMEGGFPFQPKVPRYNEATRLAIQEAREIMSGRRPAKRYQSFAELCRDIDAEDDDA